MIINGKTIELFKASDTSAPLIILNSYESSKGEIYRICRDLGCPDCTLAEITGLDWNSDMSPWAIRPLNADDEPYSGKADEYLDMLADDLIPAIIDEIGTQPCSIILAGYSLSGLFALYASTKRDIFKGVASCSGSMWFPGFTEYIKACDVTKLPGSVYFSLGDREARTKNELLRTVEDNTREIEKYLSENGVDTVFEINKGNHFHQIPLRIAKGIKWISEKTQQIEEKPCEM